MNEQTIRLYRPSNGTEGASFHEAWCSHCKRDLVMNGTVEYDKAGDLDYCPIIADTFAIDIDDPAYPREWRYDDGRPVCTAFEAMDAADGPSVAMRDDTTTDMFGGDL